MIAILIFAASTALPIAPCCNIIGLNARQHVALVRNDSNGRTFLLKAKDAATFARLRTGTRVSFDRKNGVAVQGYPTGAFRPIKGGKGGGHGGGTTVEIDCTTAPILCRGAKPGVTKITGIGDTTWGDVTAFCNDPDNLDACVAGPN